MEKVVYKYLSKTNNKIWSRRKRKIEGVEEEEEEELIKKKRKEKNAIKISNLLRRTSVFIREDLRD